MRACGNSKCGVSTAILDFLTFGSGTLDEFGFWSKPCSKCARAYEAANPGHDACWPFSPEARKALGIDVDCPECGGNASTKWEMQKLPYGDPVEVTLNVQVPVRHCSGCELQFTDAAAEDLQEEAVRRYLASPRSRSRHSR